VAIAIRQVTKRFGSYLAVDDVSLAIASGSLTALLGPSGSGKSTLLRIVAGLEQPDEGGVSIHGEDATELAPQERGVGFVFQHYAAFKHMSVRDNVAFALKIRKRPKNEIRDKVSELLKLVQLEGLADRYPSQLSGGQRQRMALARALAAEPRVLLLDEPFGALDARVRKELRAWLRKMHEEVPVTTVLVTHDQEEAMDVADRVAVMNEGRIEQTGKPRDLYERHEPNGKSIEAIVERVVHLGFEVRAELVLDDGRRVSAQVTRDEADELDLHDGQIVFVRPSRTHVFGAATAPPGHS
jgi:sulfate/thiosulfate transport system ATP-binding protein